MSTVRGYRWIAQAQPLRLARSGEIQVCSPEEVWTP
jgi:hypothetical protein